MARMLIVEDSSTQAREMQLLLEDAGHMVELVSDGLEALKALRRATPDLVVTDLMMPGMDGMALVDAIRTDFPYVPVVLVTAFGSEQAAAHALRAGAASYVPKRNLAHDLVPTVDDLLAVAERQIDHGRFLGCLTRAEFQLVLESDMSLITPVVSYLDGILSAMGQFDPTEVIRLEVALREVLVNAIGHGNLELDPALRRADDETYQKLAERRRSESPYRDRRVEIEVRLSATDAVFVVRDQGPGFDPSRLPGVTDPAQLGKLGGRGLLLVRTFMDEVRYNPSGNEVTLIKHVRPHAPGLPGHPRARGGARPH